MEKTEITIPILSEESVERAVFKAMDKYYSKNSQKAQNNQEETDRPLSIKEACKFLGISVPTMYSWINQRRLKVSRIGNRVFITKSELLNVISKNLV